MSAVLQRITNFFALWVVVGTVWAWVFPSHFTWFAPYIRPGLGVIMLGMGLTLRFEDFLAVIKVPKAIAVGVGAQFLVMPALGWGVSRVFEFPPEIAAGVILVACCPGGTASNVIAYLARANLALSVLLTMTSTLCSVILTPLLVKGLAGAILPVDAWGMFKSMIVIVLLPLVLGVMLNRFIPRVSSRLVAFSPLVSVLVIVLIVGCIVGLRRDLIRESAAALICSMFVLHLLGFLFGYLVVRALGLAEDFRRTVSIEVGMQNSGLGAALAREHFPAPVTEVPSAISAVYHCVIGSFLAAIWRRFPPGGSA